MDIYQSARLIAGNGNLNKNKGVMIVGAGGNPVLNVRGMSGPNVINSQITVTTNAASPVIIVPVPVYGITLNSATVLELN